MITAGEVLKIKENYLKKA